MKRCASCKQGTLTEVTAVETIRVGDHVFSVELRGTQCSDCSETFFDASTLERFELRTAVELAKAGEISGEVMRFLRKALGMRATDLAELLDVAPETVSRWETGKQTIERRTMGLLDALVRERFEGRTTTLESLQALQSPRALGRRIRFNLDDVLA